jgi:hypothetical protein
LAAAGAGRLGAGDPPRQYRRCISYFNDDDFDPDNPDSLSDEVEDINVPEFSNFFTVLRGQATGALSSFLTAELGEALGLEGFGGQLFSTVVNRSIGAVLNTVVDNLLKPNIPADIFAGFSVDKLITNIEFGIGALIGGYLARQIVQPETEAGAIGASLGSAIGTFLGTSIASGFASAIAGEAISGTLAAIGASFAEALGLTVAATAGSVGALFSTLGAFIIPGIGAFIGVILVACWATCSARSRCRRRPARSRSTSTTAASTSTTCSPSRAAARTSPAR